MKATDVLVKCLEEEGVQYIFGIMGKETLDFIDSLSKSKQIQFVNVRHEQGAAFMADVYGRLSQKPGVCLATLGPGATNLLTGIASAALDHSPVVAITGQAGFERQHKESHQYIQIVKMYEQVTKWSIQIKDSQSIPEIIRKAFRFATMEKPGPVLIELPENLAAQMIPNSSIPAAPIPKSIPIIELLQETASLINQSLKPFIIVGNGVCREPMKDELRIFIDKLLAPVVHSFKAKGILPKNHPQNYYTFGFNERDEVLKGIEESDLLIVIGFDFVERLPKEWNKKKRPVIHIAAVPAEIDEYYPLKMELVGNLEQTLQALNKLEIFPRTWVPSENLKERIEQAYQLQEGINESFSIISILHKIEKLASERTIIISDVGAHKVSIARTYQPKQPNRLIMSNGLAAMGIALPGAIGAKLACPNAPVICITGDGGALMNFAEIETATRLGLSFIIIILNDAKLKLEEEMMMKTFHNRYGTAFGNPDFMKLANSFHIKGLKPVNIGEFEKMLTEAQLKNELTLIEIQLDT
ncbi:acetolactate synthase large subunit [Bacillus sp. Bva_UNVM-123]|uniref:acetolactate synthase large subunit n=1 Tax=Bacillus sp. Bva_UNVM-123 TaxID=2829798 RepID=UPI00391F3EB9